MVLIANYGDCDALVEVCYYFFQGLRLFSYVDMSCSQLSSRISLGIFFCSFTVSVRKLYSYMNSASSSLKLRRR